MSLLTDQRTASGLVQKYVGTAYDTVKLVADNLEELLILADVEGIDTISENADKAEAARIAAEAASSEAVAAVDAFTDFYLGAKATPPVVDLDGAPLQEGALYQDTSVIPNLMKFWNGSNWLIAYSTSSVTSHSALSYLESDDHLQYLTETRHSEADHGMGTLLTPPSSPNEGDPWFNAEEGIVYVWYISPITLTAQWVASN